jgi:hypothetical protein
MDRTVALLAFLLSFPVTALATETAACNGCNSAAGDLLRSLTATQAGDARFRITAEERTDWTYLPWGHHGLSLNDMNEAQREHTRALVRSALSAAGIAAFEGVIELEHELRENTLFKWFRDPGRYYLAVFGDPGDPDPAWSWRFGGHHLSINVTHGPDGTSATPLFTGANPATVHDGARRGLRLLGLEEDMARALMLSLDGEQRSRALLDAEAPEDILTGRDAYPSLECCQGLPAAAMTPGQRQELRLLVERVVGRLHRELADGLMARVTAAGFDRLHFAWAGSTDSGEGHYFRVHGETLLIEYDNTQNEANHVHMVLREPGRDFGGDPLRRHLADKRHD